MKIIRGEGSKKANIMFVGEAPGREEVRQGRPFVGRAGKFLDELLKKSGIERKNVFITNVVKVGLPGNRRPTRKEIKKWLPDLSSEMHEVEPKKIVLLGDTALRAFFPGKKISEVHGRKLKRGKLTFIPTFHPSAGMRFPKIRKMMERDFKKIR